MSYCTRQDIESVWNPADVLDAADDDGDSTLSTAEAAHIDRAIERGADLMNGFLLMRYAPAALATSTWCRDCNAVLAACFLASRNGEAPPAGLQAEYERYLDHLAAIRDGRLSVPDATGEHDFRPTVSNFHIDLREPRAKVRRVSSTSTGQPPPGSVKSFPETD